MIVRYNRYIKKSKHINKLGIVLKNQSFPKNLLMPMLILIPKNSLIVPSLLKTFYNCSIFIAQHISILLNIY